MDPKDQAPMPSLEPPIDEMSSFSSNIAANEAQDLIKIVKKSPRKIGNK